jgi:hypothetical protein
VERWLARGVRWAFGRAKESSRRAGDELGWDAGWMNEW